MLLSKYMEFTVEALPPFRLDFTVWALRRREKNIVDHWDRTQYSRVWVSGNNLIKINAVQGGTSTKPQVIVAVKSKAELPVGIEQEIKLSVQKVLGLNVDLAPFYRIAESSEIIAPLVHQFMGVKPPRFPSVFEALVNAIACQQVSLDAGIQILNRFCAHFGPRFEDGDTISYAFPRPEDLINVSESDIKAVGFSSHKAQSVKSLVTGIENGTIDLIGLETMTNADVVKYLLGIRGIGRWSAEYVLLRGLGRLDMFPGDDVGAQNNLKQIFHLDSTPDYEGIHTLTSTWRPYQGMVYFHLLLNKLRSRGSV